MSLTDRAIEYPRLVILGVLLLCAVGLFAMFDLPKERTPRIRLPVIIVVVPNPGGTPATNESQIVRKIEDEAGTLPGLKEQGGIISHAMTDAAVVQFTFNEHIHSTEARRDVESLINRIKNQFPPNAQSDPGPSVSEVTFDQFPIIQVFIAGGQDGRQRRRVAERLQTQIEKVDGVAAVDIFGGLEREVEIEVDPNRMAIYGFAYQQVEVALRRANIEAPSGSIERPGGADQHVSTLAKLGSIDDIAQVPLGVRDEKPVLLADVARVTMGNKPIKSLARYGGEDAAVLLVRAKPDIDVLAAANAVQGTVDQFIEAHEGEGTLIGTVRSQAREINTMLSELGTDAWQGVVLLLIVLWVVFGWRNATLISISLPFSLVAMAAFMWFSKHSFLPDLAINNMTLFAVILVMGEVVDGSIVAGENIYRHRELGAPPKEAARRGLREVKTALLASYGTTFGGYSALFLVRGVTGQYLQLLPIVSIYSLLAAMIGLYFLLPVVSVYLMRSPKHKVAGAPAEAAPARRRWWSRRRPLGVDHAPPGTGHGDHAAHTPRAAHAAAPEVITPQLTGAAEIAQAEAMIARSRIKRLYGRMLAAMLPHRRLVLALTVVATALPPALLLLGAIGFEFFPEADVNVVEVNFELPLGSSLENRTAKVAGQIEQAVDKAVHEDEWYRPGPGVPRVKPVTTLGDPGALNIRVDADQGRGPEYGMVYVELEQADKRHRTAAQIRRAIAAALPPMPGVVVRVTSPSEGPPVGAPIVLRVLGQGDTPLAPLAQRAATLQQVLEGVPGCRDVTCDYHVRPELVVTPNRDVASLFGVDTAQIATSVNYALDGAKVGEVDFGGHDKIDLRLRNLASERDKFEDLADLPLRSPTGKIVTLEQVADIQRAMNPSVIEHYDRKRVVSVRTQLETGALADDVKAALVAAVRPDLSPSEQRALVLGRRGRLLEANDAYATEIGGENQMRDDATRDLALALIVAMFANWVILVVQFNRFIQPAIIVATIPVCLVGVFAAFLACGMNFSISAMIGVVAMSGVVVDNGILIVTFTNHWRSAGAPMDKAVIYAGQMRLRPILLTTIVTMAGLLPTVLNIGGGGELWVPLSLAFISGLACSTVIQLLIVPLACYAFEPRAKRAATVPHPAQAPHASAADPGVAPA